MKDKRIILYSLFAISLFAVAYFSYQLYSFNKVQNTKKITVTQKVVDKVLIQTPTTSFTATTPPVPTAPFATEEPITATEDGTINPAQLPAATPTPSPSTNIETPPPAP